MNRAVRTDARSDKVVETFEDPPDVMSPEENQAREAAAISAQAEDMADEMAAWEPIVDSSAIATALSWCDEAESHPDPPAALQALLDQPSREWLKMTRRHINRLAVINRHELKVFKRQAKKLAT